jgi:hypothetical protein
MVTLRAGFSSGSISSISGPSLSLPPALALLPPLLPALRTAGAAMQMLRECN